MPWKRIRASLWGADGSQLLDVWRAACRQSGIVAILFSLVYALFGEQIVALLTSLPQIQLLADRYLFWQVVLPLVGVWCYLLDGMFIGATRAAEMRNSMAVAATGFALTLLTLPWLGNHGLWLALTVFWRCAGFHWPLSGDVTGVMELVCLSGMVKNSE